ncbi:HlyD family secretion protein [Oleidesulfovibrio sp.]|uniref:HlyD family secretion protein n=1 Tax=Oleidesulfovibrio sp. TaxID=2909707 RepID=UPI003A87599D
MKQLSIIVLLLALAGGAYFFLKDRLDQNKAASLQVTPAAEQVEARPASRAVAPGVVEPVSEERKLGFEVNGVVDSVMVSEGQHIEAGTLLAKLRDEEQQAALEAAEAESAAAQAEYDKLVRGARPAEKSEAWAAVRSARAIRDQAYKEAKRREQLAEQKHIAPEEADRAWKDYRVAAEQYEEARQRFVLVEDMFRKEDIAKASYQLQSANARVREAEAALAKTRLRAPVSGTVLRIDRKAGEVFSLFYDSPVITIGDIATLNVRVEVDEKDVARVKPGQSAYIVADAYGQTHFTGKVTRIELLMGKKHTRTGDPSEHMDRRVREVLITLDGTPPLISGLRVDAYIDTGKTREEAAGAARGTIQ